MSKKQGLSLHCHHDTLIEFCYDYDKRVEYIKKEKPEHEQEIRLRLFKLLPQEAVKEIPENLVKAYAEREKAYAEREKAYAEFWKADAEFWKADAEYKKAD